MFLFSCACAYAYLASANQAQTYVLFEAITRNRSDSSGCNKLRPYILLTLTPLCMGAEVSLDLDWI